MRAVRREEKKYNVCRLFSAGFLTLETFFVIIWTKCTTSFVGNRWFSSSKPHFFFYKIFVEDLRFYNFFVEDFKNRFCRILQFFCRKKKVCAGPQKSNTKHVTNGKKLAKSGKSLVRNKVWVLKRMDTMNLPAVWYPDPRDVAGNGWLAWIQGRFLFWEFFWGISGIPQVCPPPLLSSVGYISHYDSPFS